VNSSAPNLGTHDSSADSSVDDIVLVVEDDVLVRTAIADYLRECGYKVIVAVNADEAVIVLQQRDVKIDVVLTDVKMPGSIDGFGLSRWIRENHPDLEVILFGSTARAAEVAGELCERGPHLKMPYAHHVLLERIRHKMSRRRISKRRHDQI
jgi:DNA-binding response OmpR family regulator